MVGPDVLDQVFAWRFDGAKFVAARSSRTGRFSDLANFHAVDFGLFDSPNRRLGLLQPLTGALIRGHSLMV